MFGKHAFEKALALGTCLAVGGAIYGVHWQKVYQRELMHRAVIHDRLQEQKEIEERERQQQQQQAAGQLSQPDQQPSQQTGPGHN